MQYEKKFLSWWKKNAECYAAIFFDIDGTLISGRQVLPGAVELIDRLRQARFPFSLLTNDSNHSLEEKVEIMAQRGLTMTCDEIVSCGSALKPLAEARGYVGKKFFAMGELGVPDCAQRAGINVVRDISRIASCCGVIIGEGTYNWQSNINAVVNYFISRRSESAMIVPNPDSYWPSDTEGGIGIGAGGKARFVCAILREYGIKVRPVYLGKPYRPIYRCALKRLRDRFSLSSKCSGQKILMLGDSLFSDIRGANRVGFSSGLLLTGITRAHHLEKARGHCRPQRVFRSL